jgi:hypothetical protein
MKKPLRLNNLKKLLSFQPRIILFPSLFLVVLHFFFFFFDCFLPVSSRTFSLCTCAYSHIISMFISIFIHTYPLPFQTSLFCFYSVSLKSVCEKERGFFCFTDFFCLPPRIIKKNRMIILCFVPFILFFASSMPLLSIYFIYFFLCCFCLLFCFDFIVLSSENLLPSLFLSI